MKRHTIGLVPGSTPGTWATFCIECSGAAQDWVPTCETWAERPPRSLIAEPPVVRDAGGPA